MEKIGEILSKKLIELKIGESEFKEVYDGLLKNNAEYIDLEKERNELKVKLDEAEKKNVGEEVLKKQLEEKEKEIIDLKKQYIDRFEKGEFKPKGDDEDKGTDYKTFDDLFEKSK